MNQLKMTVRVCVAVYFRRKMEANTRSKHSNQPGPISIFRFLIEHCAVLFQIQIPATYKMPRSRLLQLTYGSGYLLSWLLFFFQRSDFIVLSSHSPLFASHIFLD